jgi:hypothetical protein
MINLYMLALYYIIYKLRKQNKVMADNDENQTA